MPVSLKIIAALALAAVAAGSRAADWSDTAISLRYGTKFAEPYGATDIKKGIVALTHASGFKYGTNFFNADVLMSNYKDPGDGIPGHSGAYEIYVVYRNTLDIGKIMGQELKYGPVRGLGFTSGVDLNTKNDGYASKKRMFVFGPTVMFDVPGFANASVLLFNESNAPKGITSRYHYRAHAAFELDWGIPLPIDAVPLSFNGYALYITSKGNNEFGGPTDAETHIDATLMLDAGQLWGGPKHTFLVGLEYEYWKNKFGNPTTGEITPFTAGPGATAKTPMIRAEYHF